MPGTIFQLFRRCIREVGTTVAEVARHMKEFASASTYPEIFRSTSGKKILVAASKILFTERGEWN